MCLYVKANDPILIATEDIIVYKSGYKCENGDFLSLFMNYRYKKHKLQESTNINIYIPDKYSQPSSGEVHEGYHSYKFLKDCKVIGVSDVKAATFIIPKGSPYIEGKFSGSISYVSSVIVFKDWTSDESPKGIRDFIRKYLKIKL